MHYMDAMSSRTIAGRLEALGNETRLEIYRALVRAGMEGLPVGELQKRTGVARSTLSHHLHKLISAGLVYQERQATTLLCRADFPAMEETIGYLVRECCADAKMSRALDDSA